MDKKIIYQITYSRYMKTKTIKEWLVEKKDWITSPDIDQTEQLTEEEYNQVSDTWRKMGVLEDYKHQDKSFAEMCKASSWCRCSQ